MSNAARSPSKVDRPGYQLVLQESVLSAQWHPIPYARGHDNPAGNYVHGRDYSELLTNIVPGKLYRGAKIIDPRASAFNQVIRSHIANEYLHDTLRYSSEVELFIVNDPNLLKSSRGSAEGFLATIRNAFPDLLKSINPIRESIEGFKAYLSNDIATPKIIDLSALEGTPFLLGVIHVVNSDALSRWLIFGPARYRSAFKFEPIQRPYIYTADILHLFKSSTVSSIVNAANRFDEWSSTLFSGTDDKFLTLKEANSYLRFATSGETDEEIVSHVVPSQIPAPLNVSISNGIIRKAEPSASMAADYQVIQASCAQIRDHIDDIELSANLHNWAPSAKRKLERIKAHLDQLKQDDEASISRVIQLGLDVEAFRHVFEQSKEELGRLVAEEFEPLITNLGLLLTQFPAWVSFVDNAELLNSTRIPNDNYVRALKSVFESVAKAPESSVDESVTRYATQALQEASGEYVAGASSSARNILSATSRHLLAVRMRLMKSGERDQEQTSKELSTRELYRLFEDVPDALSALAIENPRQFSWLSHVSKLVGWTKRG